MKKTDLVRNLMFRYSFEKSHSIGQIVEEEREFENDEVKITMARTIQRDEYTLEWKKQTIEF